MEHSLMFETGITLLLIFTVCLFINCIFSFMNFFHTFCLSHPVFIDIDYIMIVIY